MPTISKSIDKLKDHYEIVVIGSGYGGGIAASRLSRAGRKVCVLERGREFQPGEFPETPLEGSGEIQFQTKSGRIGNESGLFEFHANDDINVLVGCGLGGTSLINANVIIEADKRVFSNPAWPKELTDDLDNGVADGYKRARTMLGANPYPEGEPNYPELFKTRAMKQAAPAANGEFRLTDIAVTFKKTTNDINHVGVKQTPCINCGDCCSGCNHTSKNTVQMNYLPDAYNHGAEIFTEINVKYLERQAGKWIIHFEAVGSGRKVFKDANPFVTADIVVLGAGTLGTTDILLRSKTHGLALSNKLGENFTGNGDVLAFAYNNDQKIDGIGWGGRKPNPDRPVGPTITSIIDTRKTSKKYKEGMAIEEGAIPGALATALPISFSVLAKSIGQDTDEGFRDYIAEKKRELVSYIRGAYHGAIRNTQTFLVMTHDSADGVMKLDNDRLRIYWPGVGKEEIFKKVRDRLYEITKALGGTFIPNPLWSNKSLYSDFFGNDLVTVHPLGGCVMADNASKGVANHKGQVFAGETGTGTYEGLYIADGAIIPTSLGANPLLTISAIAERNMAQLAKEHGWMFSYDLPSSPPDTTEPQKPGIQFTEKMTGWFSKREKDDYQKAAKLGEDHNSMFQFTLTVISDDVETMLSDENHEAAMFGTVDAPDISPEPLTVNQGVFNLFVSDPDSVGTRNMRYRMKMSSQEGKDYWFEGHKIIHDDAGLDLWTDTTTLYITVHEGPDNTAPVLGKGVLKIRPTDFVRQMTTMKVPNADGILQRLKYIADFGKFFAGTLYDTYGGIFRKSKYFSPDAPPRKKRPLRASAPEVHDFKTEDGVSLRLTRYQGGTKGPVILSHGLGVSSRIFSMDTIETNLLEYLHAHQYDVWLLDYRASIELPASEQQCTGDDIAKYDYPAAVEVVRQATGSNTVQMVVHCFGATTWTMSMLGGYLKNVRSAVVSQVSIHAKPPLTTRLKTGLHVPTMLKKLGLDSLTAYTDTESNWVDKLFDKALKIYPMEKEEHCANPVCHRITFLYGHLYEHDQLNEATHQYLHEMFGLANVTSFEHLALLCRKGHVVDFQSREVYLPHLERMAIPITFISGEENQCFLPESTEATYNLLCEKNDKDLYRRYIVPNYGHIDCIYGKNAVSDVYPYILERLNETES